MTFIKACQIRNDKELLTKHQCFWDRKARKNSEVILNINKIACLELVKEASENSAPVYLILLDIYKRGWLLEDTYGSIQAMLKAQTH